MASAAALRRGGGGAGTAVAWVRERGVYVVFVALVLFNILYTPNYATWGTVTGTLVQVTPVLLVSLGLTVVIATGGIDISIGAVMAIAAAIVPLYLHWSWPVAVLIALAVCTAAGVLNGTLVAYAGVQPIIATLALFVGGRGFAQVLVNGQLQTIDDQSFLALGRATVFGIPEQVLIAAAAAVVIYLVVKRTTFGRYIVAIGGNREAAYLSGQPVRKVLVGVYAISGLLAGVAGTLAAARLGAGDPSTAGVLIELDAIAAVVVGGTALSGGRVSVPGTIVGALLMQVINATFVSNDLPPTWAQILKAVIIVAALYIQQRREVPA
jgi:ribose transport system permease protein